MKHKKVSKKKNSPSRKVHRKSVTHKKLKSKNKSTVPKRNTMALATVSYNDIISPLTHDSTLSLVKSYFPERVIKFIVQPTPKQYIQKRPGTGGKEFDYVSGWYAKKCANYVFGFNHSFEIRKKEICGTSAIVEGRFIVTDPKSGRQIFFKDDIGGHQIRFLKDKAHTAENAVDVANDYKSAATDCLKRCMAQIGFFMDVYGVGEAKEDGNYANGRPDEPQVPKNFKHGDNIHEVVIPKAKTVEAKVVQTDYIAKLNRYLDEYSKGIFTVKEKIRFVYQHTKIQVDWVKMTQQEAQLIYATLMRNQK